MGAGCGAVRGRAAAPAPVPLPLSLLQLGLGCSLVALALWALALSGAARVKNACPLWAGCSVILSGILGLTTWRRQMMLLANLFVLVSLICVLLNLAAFILGCQGVQFVSSVPRCDLVDIGEKKVCFCCKEFNLTECTEETALKLYHVKLCSDAHLLLKDESQIEDQDHTLDPDDFVPPVPPPPYFATFYSCTPQMSRRMLGSDVIPLPHIYRARIKGIEVFCPLDPPPPYEAVQSQNSSEQEGVLQGVMEVVDLGEVSDKQASQGEEILESSSRVSLSPSDASLVPVGSGSRAFRLLQEQSRNDPVLSPPVLQGVVPSCEAATQTEVKPQLCAVTLRKSMRARALRGRPQSLIDYKSYTDTKQLVAWILKQSYSSISPDVQELVENIKSVLESDEEHMAEAFTSATFLEEVMAPAQQDMSLNAHALPFTQHPTVLHLESCGDISTLTTGEDQIAERRVRRADPEWPHSLIGVVRETVL